MSLLRSVCVRESAFVCFVRATIITLLVAAAFLIGDIAPVLGPAQTSSDVLPKLAPVQESLLDNDLVRDPSTGRVLLRFTNTIGNYGDGVLHVVAYRDAGGNLDAYQRVSRADGTWHDEPVGDLAYHEGHHHYHFLGADRYRLIDTSTGLEIVLAESLVPPLCHDDDALDDLADPLALLLPWSCVSTAKVSFCLADVMIVDDTSPAYSHVPKYNSCAHNRRADFVSMGVSVGWGDTYDRRLIGQAFDVTELMSKTPRWYTLESTTNPDGMLWEENRDDPASTRVQVWLGQGVPMGVGKSRPGV